MSNNAPWFNQLLGTSSTPASTAIKPLKSASNPFSSNQGAAAKTKYHSEGDAVGENRPYFSPRFLGYHNNQAVYGGSRLNVCC